ncbi:hypothetical protein ACFCX4_17185 [Kitasatospora sp. NPDC056327]|uniref:hypothetical protein n=1 Tax=Kitasatospora sp. NPDC056327 TaxID=3345785 RepID=UPI0035E1346C
MGTDALSPAMTAHAAPPPPGAAFDAWRTWRRQGGARAVVAAGILAANARNVQPWRFALDADGRRVLVHADPARRQGALDPFDRELHVGLGCALENMVLAARAQGLAPVLHLAPDPERPGHAATLYLDGTGPGPRTGPRTGPGAGPAAPPGPAGELPPFWRDLYEAIPYRRTNRGPFRDRPPAPDLLDELTAAAGTEPGAPALHWFTAPAERARVAALLVEATEAVIADEGQSRSGHRWYRGSDRAVARTADGMTVDTQGMPALMTALGKRLPAPPRTVADRFWLRNTRAVHVPTAAAFAIVTVTDARDTVQRLRGGRLLQRLHLLATARGLAVGHLNMMTVRADRERELGLAPRFGTALEELLATPGREALVTFRIGYPARPAGTSPRRPLSAVLDPAAP